MNLRNTALLAVAVILVGAYVWLEEVPSKEPEHSRTLLGEPVLVPPTQAVQHFFEFSPSDVMEVRLQHEGKTRDTQRRGNGWAGIDNPAVIDDFLRNIEELGIVKDISSDPAELRDYGLQPPRSALELRLRGTPRPLVLLLGDRNPATTGVYVRIGENGPVTLAGALVAWEFEKAFRALGERDPTPSPLAR